MLRYSFSPALIASAALLMTVPASGAAALDDPVDQWLPAPEGATWTWQWSDTAYQKVATREKYTVASTKGATFTLAWTTKGQGNSDGTSGSDGAADSQGTVDYRRTDAGLINTDWSGTAPPPSYPILCATPGQCGNSVAGAHFMLIWGSRSPVLFEPLVKGTRWSTLGGANSDVASDNRYIGRRKITTPAFPQGIVASGVQSQITQAGALGDPYGSGVRTVWWVYGVGPVAIEFRHPGGETSYAQLVETNQSPAQAPSDVQYFPLDKGEQAEFSWRNTRWMKKPSRQRVTVDDVVNNTARLSVKSLGGPIKLAGSYVYSSRLGGIVNVSAATRSASLAKLPQLGPKSLPRDERRRFTTPLDFMSWGFNPVLPSYAAKGMRWTSAKTSRDFATFGVTGSSRVLGVQRVRVPAGRYRALAVRSKFRQPGFRFGSGTRTSYFAPNEGLVKIVFRHGDGSVSTIQRTK